MYSYTDYGHTDQNKLKLIKMLWLTGNILVMILFLTFMTTQ